MFDTAAETGYYGEFGGQFVPPALKVALDEIASAFKQYKNDPEFIRERQQYMTQYQGRSTPIFYAENVSRKCGGAQIWLKREDLNHLGAHKVNNTLGQILLARRMGKKRIIAETGAGQHGVATAATAALMGMECVIYMGQKDIERQKLNVFRMEMMGAKVVAATQGFKGLKEAVDLAIADLIEHLDTTFYLLGSAVGPHPYPTMVGYFQSIISEEARAQMLQQTGALPTAVLACVGGGSNAVGSFAHFMDDKDVRLIGVEPGGVDYGYGHHAATLCLGEPGIIHGFKAYMLKDSQGEPAQVHSVSAGLDYPGVSPILSHLKDIGRAEFVSVSDKEALQAFFILSRCEGIIPALESAHALAHAMKIAPSLGAEATLLVNLSGRGDKDVAQVEEMLLNHRVTIPE
ncbi:MAG: tryptophan synthase subunit beta [Desulfovibrionaceae bacterium]